MGLQITMKNATIARMKQEAILLTGPTGCGKTPLGDHLERHGLADRSCAHFDFGAQLRKTADQGHEQISSADQNFIKEVLTCGALLEKDRLPLAATIFQAFVREKRVSPDCLLILNGLPRHVEQARFMADLVEVRQVVHLSGSPAVVCHRIQADTGGDRAGRPDDTLDAIAHKLELYQQRTLPLLDYYRQQGVPVQEYPVSHDSAAPDMAVSLIRAEWYFNQPA